MKITQNKLKIKQKVELGEVFTGIETKNRYKILKENDKEFLYAFETSNWFLRILLKRMRPLELDVIDSNKNTVLKIKKKFAFLFPKFEVFENNQKIGNITSKGFLKNILEVNGRNGELVFKSIATIMHPWTFNIFRPNNLNIIEGTIFKKWSKFGKEMFTDSDNFDVDYKNISDDESKTLILALAFTIDLYVFDR